MAVMRACAWILLLAGCSSESDAPSDVASVPEAVRLRCGGPRPVLVECFRATSIHSDPKIAQWIDANFNYLAVDIKRDREVADWLNAEKYPSAYILDPQGRIRDRLIGFKTSQEFAEWLESILSR